MLAGSYVASAPSENGSGLVHLHLCPSQGHLPRIAGWHIPSHGWPIFPVVSLRESYFDFKCLQVV
jgi:hypothetical protein